MIPQATTPPSPDETESSAENAFTLYLEDIRGLQIRLSCADIHLRTSRETISRSANRRSRYVHFTAALLEADSRVFDVAEGFASVHPKGIDVVTAAFDEVSTASNDPGEAENRPNRKNAQSFRADA
ncbi:MAG: hypothetical protein WA771_01290 [Chthoniobacterales bacterium]